MVRWISIFPLHGSGRFVVLTDVSQELFVQIRNGSEYASGDDVALDLAEPQLNLIQPRRVGRSEVQVNLGMHRQEVRDRPALVSREVVGDHMDLFAAGLIDHNVGKERRELGRGVPRSRFAEHLPGLGVEGGVQRQGAGSLRSRAWMAVFSSTLNTAACAGGFRYNPIMSAAFFSKSGSFEAM